MEENIKRRESLFELMEDNSALLIFSGVSKTSWGDEYYPFKVDMSFFYLTNITQENSALLMIKTLSERKIYLFVDEYNELKEKWTGKRITFDEASQLSDIVSVYPRNDLSSMVELLLKDTNNQFGTVSTLYTNKLAELKIGEEAYAKQFADGLASKYQHIKVEDALKIITTLRLKKSRYEIDCLKEAINTTHRGLNEVMKYIKPGVYEYVLADIFEFYGRKQNKARLSFDSIVASGKNGVVLHYPQQNDKLNDGELVLFDVGYKYKGYSADISRTYPINGSFNELQSKIYSCVLSANKAVIEYARPGLTIFDLQKHCQEVLKNELVKVGLMSEGEDLAQYYYHGVSHFLGLDTHDVGDRNLPLEAGNVITVEPGLYFAKYGIGIRIEDDVLITEDGCEVLSRAIPKEMDEIESLFNSRG